MDIDELDLSQAGFPEKQLSEIDTSRQRIIWE